VLSSELTNGATVGWNKNYHEVHIQSQGNLLHQDLEQIDPLNIGPLGGSLVRGNKTPMTNMVLLPFLATARIVLAKTPTREKRSERRCPHPSSSPWDASAHPEPAFQRPDPDASRVARVEPSKVSQAERHNKPSGVSASAAAAAALAPLKMTLHHRYPSADVRGCAAAPPPPRRRPLNNSAAANDVFCGNGPGGRFIWRSSEGCNFFSENEINTTLRRMM
jgi:hypothetical protein